jgi:hypothetical protein
MAALIAAPISRTADNLATWQRDIPPNAPASAFPGRPFHRRAWVNGSAYAGTSLASRSETKGAPTVIRTFAVACSVAALFTIAGCGGGNSTGPAKAVTARPPRTPTTSALPTIAAAPKTAPAKTIRVPNVVGHNHQTAQDEMQAAGFYTLEEKDATGQGRLLLWDRNWVVVRQSPKAGAKVTPDTTITLYSKKIGE